MPRIESEKAVGESDSRLIQTSADRIERMSTRLRVLVWIVVVAMVVVWLAAILFVVFQPGPLPVNLVYAANRFLPIKVRAFLDFAAPRLKKVFAEFQSPAF